MVLNVDDLQQAIDEEKRKIAELTAREGIKSHLFPAQPTLPLSGVSEVSSEQVNTQVNTEEGHTEVHTPISANPQVNPPVHQVKSVHKAPVPKPGANLGGRLAPLLALLTQGPSKQPSAPPPVAKLVAEKYNPIVEQVQDAFDRMESWAIAVKNWKLWTLLLDQYGLTNNFPMPTPALPAELPNYTNALSDALTKQTRRFGSCPVLKCKQALLYEEVHKVIKPWANTNFSSALMALAESLGVLLNSIPRGVLESKPSEEIADFLLQPNAAELVYAGTSPVLNPDLSRRLTDKIRMEAMAAKRQFMDTDLLALKHQTDVNLRKLQGAQVNCTSKTPSGAQLDQIHNLQRALEWHAAAQSAKTALGLAFEFVNWRGS
jgi:hypothetical protein